MTMIQTEDTFRVKATDAMLTTAQTGNPQIAIVCEVVAGGEQGNALTWYGSFAPAALKYTVDTLVKAFGYSGNGADLWAFLDDVRGRECMAVTKFEKYNGKTRLKIKWLNPLNAGPSDDEQRKLADMLAGAIDAYSGSKGKPAAPPRDDEIPF